MANHRTMASGARLPAAAVDFDALYRDHASQVRTVAYHRLFDWGQADDVVQETFLRAYRALDRLDPDRPAWPWLRTIAEHICTDMLRRLALVSETPVGHHERDGAIPGEGDPNSDAFLGAQRRAGIKDALAQIHPRQRRMLVLQVVEGWSPGAVAEAEGMSVTAVRATLKRGRKSFRRHYLALAAQRGLLGAAALPAALVARVRMEAARAHRLATRVGGMSFEVVLPAGFVSVALAVGAATGGAAVGERPAPVAELRAPSIGGAPLADSSAAVAATHDSALDALAAGGDSTRRGATAGWDKSVGAAPGPVAVAATAGVTEEAERRRMYGIVVKDVPGRDDDRTEIWLTVPCEGTGELICEVSDQLPDN